MISELFIPNQGSYYTLHSAPFARLIVDSGEYRGILSRDGITSDEYTLKILEKYLQYDRTLQIFQALYQNGGIRIGKKLITSETAIEVMKDFFLTSEEINLIGARLRVLKRYDIEDQNKETILTKDVLKHFAEILHKSQYLFSMDIELEDDLNNRTVSEALKDAFETKGFSLSEKITFTNENVNRWVIIDEEKKKTYILRKEEGKLSIYKSTFQDCIYFLRKLKLFYPKKIEELFEITINETLNYLSVLNLAQIGKFITIYIREDVYQEFIDRYLVEKLKESDLKEIREFIFVIGKNDTEIKDELVRNTIEKLGEIDFVSKIEESNLREIRLLIYNVHNAGENPQFVIETLKKVNLISKLEESSLNDINMLIYNIDQVGGDLHG